jgi:hypothetical protein
MVVAADTDLGPSPPPVTPQDADDDIALIPEPRTSVIVAVVATVAAIAPFLAVIAIRAGHHYVLTQDLAVIDLRARDLFTTHPPLVGPWSRAGFAHPGPIFYWVLGTLAGITANASWSILVGGAVVRIAGIVATARLAWTRGGLALCLLMLAAITAAQVALEPGSLVVPWNIFAALAFFPVFLLLAWSVVLGETRRLPWLAVVGTFLVQTHIGYGLLLLPLSIWVVVRVVRDRRSTPAPTLRRAIGWSVLWLVVLWLPVLIDQLFGTGNIGAMSDYVLTTGEAKAGLVRSLGWFAERFRFVPTWAGGPQRIDAVSAFAAASSLLWLLVPAGLFAVATIAVRRRGDRPRRTFLALVALVTISSIVAMAEITGDQFAYLFEWRTVAALLIVVATAWALVPWLRTPRSRQVAAASVLVVVLGTSAFLVGRVIDLPTELRPDDFYVARVSTRLADRAPTSGHFLVRGVGAQGLGFTPTLVDLLDRRGIPVHVDRHLDYQYGPQRVMATRDARTIWLITEKGWVGNRLRRIPGARVIYASTGLPPAQERELERGQLRLLAQLRAVKKGKVANSLDSQLFALLVAKIPGVDQALARRVATLDARSAQHTVCRCVVVGFDHPDARTRRAIARIGS